MNNMFNGVKRNKYSKYKYNEQYNNKHEKNIEIKHNKPIIIGNIISTEDEKFNNIINTSQNMGKNYKTKNIYSAKTIYDKYNKNNTIDVEGLNSQIIYILIDLFKENETILKYLKVVKLKQLYKKLNKDLNKNNSIINVVNCIVLMNSYFNLNPSNKYNITHNVKLNICVNKIQKINSTPQIITPNGFTEKRDFICDLVSNFINYKQVDSLFLYIEKKELFYELNEYNMLEYLIISLLYITYIKDNNYEYIIKYLKDLYNKCVNIYIAEILESKSTKQIGAIIDDSIMLKLRLNYEEDTQIKSFLNIINNYVYIENSKITIIDNWTPMNSKILFNVI